MCLVLIVFVIRKNMKRFFLILILLTVLLSSLAYNLHPEFFSVWWTKPTNGALILYGNVDIRQVDLGFRVGGRVASMPFQEGDYVSSGVLMAQLDKQPYKDQVAQAAAHVQSTEATLANANLLVSRRKELLGTGGISRQDIDDAIAAQLVAEASLKEAQAALGIVQTNLSDTEIFSPDDGTILTRIREPGTVVKEADPIYTLSLLNPVWVRAYVSETRLGEIHPGMAAEIYTDTPGGKTYIGHIGFISPVAEFTPKTVETTALRTNLVYRLRVIVENPSNELKQGMPVTVKIPINSN